MTARTEPEGVTPVGLDLSSRVEEALVRARLRRERRLLIVMRAHGAFPTRATWRTLDLVHEATHLVDRLETAWNELEDRRVESLVRERYA